VRGIPAFLGEAPAQQRRALDEEPPARHREDADQAERDPAIRDRVREGRDESDAVALPLEEVDELGVPPEPVGVDGAELLAQEGDQVAASLLGLDLGFPPLPCPAPQAQDPAQEAGDEGDDPEGDDQLEEGEPALAAGRAAAGAAQRGTTVRMVVSSTRRPPSWAQTRIR